MPIDTRTPIQRFMAKVVRLDNGCMQWTAYRNTNGYGRFKPQKGAGMALAHRWSYEYHVGPIPTGLVLDHLCRNPSCVNPAHLEPVTQATNVRRGRGNGSKTHCPQGHPYSGDNLITRRGSRFCRACRDHKNALRKAS